MVPRGAQSPLALYRRLALLLGGSRRLLLLAVSLAAAQSLLLVPVGLLVREVFDEHLAERDRSAIVLSALGMLGLYVGSTLLGVAARRVVARETRASVGRLRVRLLEHLYRLPQSWHDRQDPAAIHTTLVTASDRVETLAAQLFIPLLSGVIVALALVAVAVVLAPVAFAGLALTGGLIFVAAQRTARRAKQRGREWSESFHRYGAGMYTTMRTMRMMRAAGADAWDVQRRRAEIRDLEDTGRDLVVAHTEINALHGTFAVAAGAAILVIGGMAVVAGSLSVGELLAFYAVTVLLLRQLTVMAPALDQAATVGPWIERIEALLATDPGERYGGPREIVFAGDVTVEDVTFGYEPGRPVLRGVRLALARGEHVALTGASGAGKSTLVGVVLGLLEPWSGRVLADGVPYEELDLRVLRRQVGVVLQEALLVPGTVRENITYGAQDVSDETVAQAARAALAEEFIAALPDGLDTMVGDDGLRLSAGQRQRLVIARALVCRPPLLALDEPTTYLDSGTVSALLENLKSLPGGPAVLMVTHDPTVAASADRVLELRDGRVHERRAAIA